MAYRSNIQGLTRYYLTNWYQTPPLGLMPIMLQMRPIYVHVYDCYGPSEEYVHTTVFIDLSHYLILSHRTNLFPRES